MGKGKCMTRDENAGADAHWRVAIVDAWSRIGPHVRRTPVIAPSDSVLGPVQGLWLKLEQLQHTGSFKARGAFNAILGAAERPARVVAVSGGNHGAAVAYAAASIGIPSTVFAPQLAGEVKIARMRSFGAQVEVRRDIGIAFADAEAMCKATGALFIHPFDQAATVAGQGTIGMEFEEQLPDLDTLLIAVGGDVLIAGIAAWYQGRIRIIAVESEGTATLATSLRDGPQARIVPSGIAASALGAQHIGAIAFDLARRHVEKAVVVSDGDIIEAQRRLWSSLRVIGEPGGVTALAALTSGAYVPMSGERVGVLICGANADPGWFL
jgi:threonine dehydratase